MAETPKLKLDFSCILNIPIDKYPKNFAFIVNGKEFKTCRFVSDLLSPIICISHSIDPALDIFNISTKEQGDFSKVLQLIDFNELEIKSSELPFILEVLEILGNESVNIILPNQSEKITRENVFTEIKKHEKYPKIFKQIFEQEIDFISSHFYEICESYEKELKNLKIDTLYDIIGNPKLRLETENQLLNFVNKLYSENSRYSILYEKVSFIYASEESISKFIEIYDLNDLNVSVWMNISKRLKEKVQMQNEDMTFVNKRFIKQKVNTKTFIPNDNGQFSGIINFIHEQTLEPIQNKLCYTASSIESTNDNFQPFVIGNFEKDLYFVSNSCKNSWICINFNNYRIIPTHYTIKSAKYDQNGPHLKNWVIEVSNDENGSWTIIDEHKNCSDLNGNRISFTFEVSNKVNQEYKFIRLRQTNSNWRDDDKIIFESFEIYGTLIYDKL